MKETHETNLWSGAIVLCLMLIFLAGCATKPTGPNAEDTIKAGLMDGAIAAAKAPLFKLTCPALGCVLGSLEIGNPAGAGQMAEVVKIAMTPQPSEASQNFRAVMGVISNLGGYAIIGHAASSIMGKVVDGYASGFASNVSIAKSIPQPGATTTNTNISNTTNSLSGTGVLGSGTYTAPITTTTTTDRHDVITNPNPVNPRICTTNAAGVLTCQGG